MSGTDRAGAHLRELRKARGLTQVDVARALGLSERTVRRHEDGTTPLLPVHQVLYAGLYGAESDQGVTV
jgi:transcriptional regulator with XRE-family HTH domain